MLKKKINVIPIPGVSSITAAMAASGFKDKFLFYGFLPKTENELDKVLSNLSNYEYTQIYFISALKVNFYLKKIKKYFSNRKIMIGKEITKIHEEFIRGDIENLKLFSNPLKGELTLVISNSHQKKSIK